MPANGGVAHNESLSTVAYYAIGDGISRPYGPPPIPASWAEESRKWIASPPSRIYSGAIILVVAA